MKRVRPDSSTVSQDDGSSDVRINAEIDQKALDNELLYQWYHEPGERAELADKLALIRTEMRLRQMTGPERE